MFSRNKSSSKASPKQDRLATQKIVVFGSTGAVGTAVVQEWAKLYPQAPIVAVTRSISRPSRVADVVAASSVTMVEGDPLDKESVLDLTRDCAIIFCCVGFHKYEAAYWGQHWPVVVENLLAAVVAAQPAGGGTTAAPRRKLVFCDNLYAYGSGHGASAINTTTTPRVSPDLRRGKPHVRSWMHQRMTEHIAAYPGTLAVVGGADFFGPHVTAQSFLGDTMTGKLVNGETALAVGSATVVHDFCYVTDFARALVVAARDDRALDKFWICPHSIHGKSLQQIANDIAAKIGGTASARTPAPVSVLPRFMLYILAPFVGFMGEMIEMYPFWSQDYRIDDSDFCRTFGVEATPYDEALQSLVDFYQNQKK